MTDIKKKCPDLIPQGHNIYTKTVGTITLIILITQEIYVLLNYSNCPINLEINVQRGITNISA